MEEFWYTKKSKEVLSDLKTNPDRGLGSAEVLRRRESSGENILPRRPAEPWWVILGRQFASPLVYILFIGGGISFYVQEFLDAVVIFGAVLLNAIIGFIQEYKANASLHLIQSAVVFETTVLRDGEQHRIQVNEVVPGDIVILEAGDRVPADGRLIQNADLQSNEATLTGESLPVEKTLKPLKKKITLGDRTNMVFMGTTIVRGSGRMVVTGTGIRTEFGHIATLIRDTREEDTPLQEQIKKLARMLAGLFVALSTLLVVIGLIQQRPFVELFVTAIAVAVAAIPEGLLVAVTVVLAVGMQRILNQNAIVKRLVAAETLGSVSIVCTDKTGTLTKAEMEPAVVIYDGKVTDQFDAPPNAETLWTTATLCNNAFFETEDGSRTSVGDPTETALLRGVERAGMLVDHIRGTHERLFEIPFDSDAKYMAVLTSKEKELNVWVKGAPEVILNRCTHILGARKTKLTKKKIDALLKNTETYTEKGLRLLALAYKPIKRKNHLTDKDVRGLIFLGIVALKDPLRADAKGVIKWAMKAGVRPVLITGDHKRTAQAIMHELDLPSSPHHTLTGAELDDLDEKAFRARLKKTWIYARVEPRHKVRIVEAWRDQGEVVAMIGDGVNDAASLKAADIGLALGSGTDVAKETADIILQENTFKVVIDAIREGRRIFQNIRNVTTFLMIGAFTEIILIGGALILRFPLPVLAGQILWVNLVEDTFPALALAFERETDKRLTSLPRKREEPIFNREIKWLVFGVGLITDIVLLGLFYYYEMHFQDISFVRTIMFVGLGIDSLTFIFAMRSLIKPLWRMNPFSNRYVNGSVLIGFLLLALPVYVPFFQSMLKTSAIRPVDWLILILLALVKLGMVEGVKYVFLVRAHNKRYGGSS